MTKHNQYIKQEREQQIACLFFLLPILVYSLCMLQMNINESGYSCC